MPNIKPQVDLWEIAIARPPYALHARILEIKRHKTDERATVAQIELAFRWKQWL
jgi:hypothetical protein